jgi:hypothetical protein
MPFERDFELNISELSPSTRYRFAELEINQLLTLAPNRSYWNNFLLKYVLAPDNFEEATDQFFDVATLKSFTKPRRAELAAYFMYHNLGYKAIQDKFGISSRTVAKYRFNIPELHPDWRHWNLDTYNNWQQHKHSFNLWRETLIQSQET